MWSCISPYFFGFFFFFFFVYLLLVLKAVYFLYIISQYLWLEVCLVLVFFLCSGSFVILLECQIRFPFYSQSRCRIYISVNSIYSISVFWFKGAAWTFWLIKLQTMQLAFCLRLIAIAASTNLTQTNCVLFATNLHKIAVNTSFEVCV